MKKTFVHIVFSLFFAGIFLFAGTGYNIIQYCCDDCKNAGIEMVAEMSCESIHHHHYATNTHTNQTANGAVTCMNELAKNCDIDRLTVDIPSVHSPYNELIDYSLIYVELTDYQAINFSIATFSPAKYHFCPLPPNIPPQQDGRQILSNISILRI